MATTRLIPMHKNSGKSIAQCLAERIDYAKNHDKTEGGDLVTTYACTASIADKEFAFSKEKYLSKTGRLHSGDVIAYQLRQSFKPGEITPEKANKLSYELAMSFTKGKHAFLVATHTDKEHIHSHIIFNSTSLDCDKKFRNFYHSSRAIRRISDRICLENGYSIIENPNIKSKHYGETIKGGKTPTVRDDLRSLIDAYLPGSKTLDDFISALKRAGCEVKLKKNIAIKRPEGERFIRLNSLGDGYSESDIRAVIDNEKVHVPAKLRRNKLHAKSDNQVNMLIDIQEKLLAGKGAGYERWAKVFNLKQMAKTFSYLSENNLLSQEMLNEKAEKVTAERDALSEKIKLAEASLSEIAVLKTAIINYSKTRQIYIDYRKSGYSKKFLAEHETEIALHKNAKKVFDDAGLEKIPKVKELNVKYDNTLTQKKADYKSYTALREESRELLMAKANVERILNEKEDAATREKEKKSR